MVCQSFYLVVQPVSHQGLQRFDEARVQRTSPLVQ